MTFLQHIHARLRKVRGHVDGVINGHLVGWAQPLGADTKELRVGLYARGALLAQAPANIYRGDLEAAGIGDGHFGFSIPLIESLHALVAANGGRADLCVQGPRLIVVGHWDVADLEKQAEPATALPSDSSELQKLVYGNLQRMSELSSRPALTRQDPKPLPETHAKLFAHTDYINPDQSLPEQMFGYAEYIRYRDRLDEKYHTADTPDDIAHFFKRYLGVYSAMRGGLRIPLSRAAIDYLNTPVTIPGQRNSFTRAMWAFVLDQPNILQAANFSSADWFGWATFWWAHNQAKAIHCEDCLVTEDMIALLQAVPEDQQQNAWDVSDFMYRLALEVPALAALDRKRDADRRSLGCALLVMAVARPEYLRYIPTALVTAALDDSAGPSPLAQFCADMGQPCPDLNRETYAAILRHQTFDLDTLQFTTFTAEGHRLEFASLPALTAGNSVDVQIIGPFKKASGLGQAARLSAEMLEQSGVSVNKVNFGLDNPAPEGFSRAETVADYQNAKVNLIHLNAEAIPLTYAYQPDCFTNAYNIGYFFWELDSPGACHYLGMDMLDEIWVSTEFGVQVFQPHIDIPVTNVGMSYEALPEVDRDDARAYLRDLIGLPDDDFVFMVTFDSFSFVQRKNPLGVLEAFQAAFPKEDPANSHVRLVIKTQNRTKIADPDQINVWEQVDRVLKGDARIVLMNETLAYKDLLRFKKGADAYLSLHRSEGWGFGMIEAMNLRVPVICTLYSGNVDFCPDGTCWPVDFTLTELGLHDYIFVRDGQKWAEPDTAHAAKQMRAMHDDPEEARKRADAAWDFIQSDFGKDAIAGRYSARIHEVLAQIDGQRKGAAE